eukprot:3933140-Rhodomonas_salina.2
MSDTGIAEATVAMRYPVLTFRMVLRVRYATSGTDMAYGRVGDAEEEGVWSPCYLVCSPISLRARYTAKSNTRKDKFSTDIVWCSATSLRARYAMSDSDTAYGAARGEMKTLVDQWFLVLDFRLPVMSGTDLAYGPSVPHNHAADPGTKAPIWSYAPATRSPVLSARMVLPGSAQ